jgi:hypothetical protein
LENEVKNLKASVVSLSLNQPMKKLFFLFLLPVFFCLLAGKSEPSKVTVENTVFERTVALEEGRFVYYIDAAAVLKSIRLYKWLPVDSMGSTAQRIRQLETLPVGDTLVIAGFSRADTVFEHCEMVVDNTIVSGKLGIYDKKKKKVVTQLRIKTVEDMNGCRTRSIYVGDTRRLVQRRLIYCPKF